MATTRCQVRCNWGSTRSRQACSRPSANVGTASVDPPASAAPKMNRLSISAGRWGRTAKLVIVVGPDVDPYDMDSVEWAIMTRWQPVADTLVNNSGPPMVLDPSCEKSALTIGSP